ncbi:MAG: CCA tRNA nucleotidyltransferase [Cyanobacteria bacterium P01_F01_bin.150]
METLPTPLPLRNFSRFTGPILDPYRWPFDFNLLPPSSFLVGGSVRDALLGRQSDHIDLDFVMPEGAVETARAIATHYKAGFVLLDARRNIARVVFEDATADFAQQVGDSLEVDLWRRDFTVNAIAYNPRTKELYDPLEGYEDLQRGIIRMISDRNLKDDPLRLLRAYRQSAQLGFVLEINTRHHICELAPLLKNIAPERVHAELSYLLSSDQGTPMLTQAWSDGLLNAWLPKTSTLGVSTIQAIDQAFSLMIRHCSAFESVLKGWVTNQQQAAGAGRSWLKTTKLACLVSTNDHRAEQQLWKLKCSRAEVQTVLTILRWLPHLQEYGTLPTTPKEQFFFFRDVEMAFPAVILMALALGQNLEVVTQMIQYFLNLDSPIAYPNPLLKGSELIQTLNLKPGPAIGQLLEKLCVAHAEGLISNHDEALGYVKKIV